MLAEFSRHYGLTFRNPALLKLALTHRSYLSVTGQGPRESNERLEFLGDSVLGLVTSEHLYRIHPGEHEGQLTKTKSLLVSKAILSRRALAMGLGRFVLMSHSEVESGGRQRLSIIADAFESVIGAIYLDQGFEAARAWIERWLLRDLGSIMADKRHANYKSHLQEYVQSTFHTHPVYRIRSEMGPDHSKHFMVEVMVGRRLLGEGKGRNKKEAEQAAARDALDRVGGIEAPVRRTAESRTPAREAEVDSAVEQEAPASEEGAGAERGRRRGRRGGRGRRPEVEAPRPAPEGASSRRGAAPDREAAAEREPAPDRGTGSERGRPSDRGPYAIPPEDGRFERLRLEAERSSAGDVEVVEVEPPHPVDDEDYEEVGRPEGPLEERHVDLFGWDAAQENVEGGRAPAPSADDEVGPWTREDELSAAEAMEEDESDRPAEEPEAAEPEEPESRPAPAPSAPPARSGPAGSSFGRRRGRRGR